MRVTHRSDKRMLAWTEESRRTWLMLEGLLGLLASSQAKPGSLRYRDPPEAANRHMQDSDSTTHHIVQNDA